MKREHHRSTVLTPLAHSREHLRMTYSSKYPVNTVAKISSTIEACNILLLAHWDPERDVKVEPGAVLTIVTVRLALGGQLEEGNDAEAEFQV
jgi:hypothetical protein